ncbi:AGC/AKT protein kinase [Phytophthora nicotianae CJ01A1]|uniref:AGC/AKT protein kinase n=7 Tax=Phytophthora nicotianae TaxID=4792 RepID=W2PLF4_PHYN3|nr:AGC/AKT protein kinase [Phytophthora nicotianae INRA-310]ETI33460.1 AGC/AKT protein kinase [Phytophthora nicotianae P1569]ETK73786.1 AGC/AKT protein kinase [Phytophthora nicotianae]ETO62217.1 AGC/AKT protein kinase [Phytophthora nicotianae P1976]ETP03303.1 AGC/AKT protein kinase [Phytophthora nicotianae CJ01A1]ETP31462.1 AGC/AKT protein kinase [Phytophthora nicotianae P10297]
MISAAGGSSTLAAMNASAESDVELMRTILGEHVPQSVILTCLNACAFDVSAALNWYFAEVASSPVAASSSSSALQQPQMLGDAPPPASVPSIQSGLSLTLHPRAMEGMVSKSEAYYATLTRGDPAYDLLTPSNDKFLTIRLRKRGWRTGTFLGVPSPATQRPYFANGDVVTLECNGLWLKASSLNKMLQWKAPSEDDRNKFVIRGLPLGKNLAPGDYFFLTSYKWKDKEIVRKDERPVGISSYNNSIHRCFLGLERIKTANQRLYLYAKLTPNALKSLPKPDDPVNVNNLTISVMGTPMSTGSFTMQEQSHSRRKDSISDEIQLTNAKIDQMANIIGTDVSRDRLANFLDGAGGDVQVALEHYFMSVSKETGPATAPATTSTSAPPPTQIQQSAASLEEAQARAHAEAQANHNRRPLSQLILGIPSISEPLPSPSTEPVSIPPPAPTTTKHGIAMMPPRPPSVDVTSTFVGEPSPGMPPPVPSPCPSPIPPSVTTLSDTSLTPAAVPRITEDEEFVDATDYTKHQEQMEQHMTHQEQQMFTSEQQGRGSESVSEAESGRAEALTIQDFEMLSVLGKGSFGAVMLVRFKKDGRVFALKIIKKNNMDQADVQNAMEERQILQRIHHPYICGLVFAFQTNERLYLGMKYYAAGDLFYHLNMKGRLSVKDAKLYGAELVLAISYLHELNILYRDLKPSNVMIDSEGHIGVVDFGLSKQHIYGSNFGVKTLSGTAEYVAPEALAQSADGSRNYGKAYDWWSLGVVIYEMLVGESPFYDENEHKMLSRIAYSDVVFPSDFPRDAYDLVKGLLCKDPKQRLGSERMGGVDAIKGCRFFRHIDWDKLLRREVKAHWTPKLSGETDTRYVDPEFIDEGPPSAAYDPSADAGNSLSKRFSQFSFNYNLG